MTEKNDPIGARGIRKDAEIFEEENLVDGSWIPLGFAWNSPTEIRERAREIEADATDGE